MKLADLKENMADIVTFDEKFIRSVAKDRGIDLSHKSRDEVLKMHEQILSNLDYRGSTSDFGQDYYDAVKEYFS